MYEDEKQFDDPRLQEIYEVPGMSLSLDLTRTRKETGLTFSKEALEDYANGIAAFVTTRVMKYWKETNEPPVKMNTLVTVAINDKAVHPTVDDPMRDKDLLDEALAVARSILKVHEHVGMDTAEDKALHAKACETFHDAIAAIERLRG